MYLHTINRNELKIEALKISDFIPQVQEEKETAFIERREGVT